jgi:glutamate dehydrogenase
MAVVARATWRDAAARRPADAAVPTTPPACVLAHVDLAASRPDGTIALRVFTPTVAEHGWSTGHTLVQVVVEDMPFLVDSVVAALSQLDVNGARAHPPGAGGAPRRHRTPCSRCCERGPARPAGERAPTNGTSRGSPSRSAGRPTRTLRQIESTLRRVLRDVGEAVEDYPKMRQRALDAADGHAELSRYRSADAEVTDAEELLRWLADDHFTFLGLPASTASTWWTARTYCVR